MFSSIRYTSNKIFFQKFGLDVYDLDKNNLKKKPIVRMYVSMPFKTSQLLSSSPAMYTLLRHSRDSGNIITDKAGVLSF